MFLEGFGGDEVGPEAGERTERTERRGIDGGSVGFDGRDGVQYQVHC